MTEERIKNTLRELGRFRDSFDYQGPAWKLMQNAIDCIHGLNQTPKQMLPEVCFQGWRLTTDIIVYCVYDEGILMEHPYALGKESFLLSPFGTMEDSWEWFYEDLGETWFFDLEKAKKKCWDNYVEVYPFEPLKWVQVSSTYWELRDSEEE